MRLRESMHSASNWSQESIPEEEIMEQTLKIVHEIHEILISSRKTVATAESCTAGLIAHLLTEFSGASDFFIQGWVTYATESKIKSLGVSEDAIVEYGVFSTQVACHMANRARTLAGTDYGIGITGLTGTSTDSRFMDRHVSISIVSPHTCFSEWYVFVGSRHEIRNAAATKALELFLALLKK